MEHYNEINKTLAQNLTNYRKAAGLTQAELAQKINYSDKSVSKWEQGNGVPDIYILLQLADLYGVTLNDLVGEDATARIEEKRRQKKWSHILIMLLSSCIIWLTATCFYVSLQMGAPLDVWWLAFVYAVVCNAILIIVFASIWKYRILHFAAVSTLIWSTIASVFLTLTVCDVGGGSLWLLFVLGAPLQALETLWVFFRSLFANNAWWKRRKAKKEQAKKED